MFLEVSYFLPARQGHIATVFQVNRKVGQKISQKEAQMQMPEPCFSLRKKFYLLPGL